MWFRRKREKPDPDQPTKDLLLEIGKALLLCQIAERHMSTVVHFVLPRRDANWRKILSGRAKPKTLGPLCDEFSELIGGHPEFAKFLKDFVKGRNILVHRLLDEPGFSFGPSSDSKPAFDFLADLCAKSILVRETLWPVIERFDADTKRALWPSLQQPEALK